MDYQLFEKAKEYINLNKIKEAVGILESLKEYEKDNFDIFFELGKAYLILNDNENAIINLKQSLTLKDNIDAKLLLAKSLKNIKKYQYSLKVLFRLKRKKIKNKEIDKEIVMLLIELKKWFLVQQYANKYLKEYYDEIISDEKSIIIAIELKNVKKYGSALNLLFKLKKKKIKNKAIDDEIIRVFIELKKWVWAKKYITKYIKNKYSQKEEELLNISRNLKNIKEYKNALNLLFKLKRDVLCNNKEVDKEIIENFIKLGRYKLTNGYINKYLKEFSSIFYEYLLNIDFNNCSDRMLLELEFLYSEFLLKQNCLEPSLVEIKLIKLYFLKKNIFLNKQQFIDKVVYKMNNTDYHFYYNNILNRFEMFDKKITLLSRPLSLSVVLTNKCNIVCKFCDYHKIHWELPDSVKEEIVKLIPYLFKVSWVGGEVFLYKHFIELFNLAKINNLQQEIVTNSMLLNEKWLNELLSSRTNLAISIRSFNKNKYETLCNGAKFEKLIDNLEYIKLNVHKRHKKFKLLMYILVTKYNFMELEELVYYAKFYNFNTVRFIQLDNIENSLQSVNICNPTFEHYEDFVEILRKSIEFLQKSNIEIRNELPININKAMSIKKYNNNAINYKEDDIFCESPWNSVSICSSGDVKFNSFCLDDQPIGNIINNTILDIWNSDKTQEFRKRILNDNQHISCNNVCVKYKAHQMGFSHHCMPIQIGIR